MDHNNKTKPRDPGAPQGQLEKNPKPEGRTYRFRYAKPTCDESHKPEEHDSMYCHVNVKTGSRGTGQSAAAKYDYISRAGQYEAGPPGRGGAPRVGLHAVVRGVGSRGRTGRRPTATSEATAACSDR